ncbi:DUF1521 domain-containing protein [Bradyrhizobium xenonodulans]|uniref:DUF1521 domain-containing protein n=1 Tax=Bradyrhizobium xenonodulans TaxID=2736875 RepID=A0ABY7MSH4_9BRAD|nr:DUF1521 domain-containing protein [Bradyrhizobium xenonodulans]WBL81350.1 DUF1521 domain-containing protein [Bradyrhizobium xenonodulans]
MTSLSLVGGFNLAVNGLLPQGAADGAVFNMLFGQLGGGGGSFVNEVRSARTSTEKSALINAYAQGFAAASGEGGASSSEVPPQSYQANRGNVLSVNISANIAGSSQGASMPEVMQGFGSLANLVDQSQLPEPVQRQTLDGIAGLMAQLQGLFHSQQPTPPNLGTPPSILPAPVNQSSTSADPVWTHETGDGKATIRLGDKYTITADEKDASWTVRNNETGHVTKVHGDPHVDDDGDGKNDFDFKKDMTFQLEDGTKITVNTVPFGNGQTLSSKLTITNGNNAITVEGLGADKDGANNLKVTQSNAGATLDQLTSDGAQTIYERGQDWTNGSGQTVNQALINAGEAGQQNGASSSQNPGLSFNIPTYILPAAPVTTDPWSHESKDGKATIRLGDKYTVTVDEKDASWTVRNNQTGHVTQISGDPHVDDDNNGKNDFDFKKDMTFQLEDGTKITVNTVPYGNGQTLSSKLTITNGSNAITVEGLGADKDGANNLKVTQSNAGATLDQLASDGADTIYERGQDWVDRSGAQVNQAMIDAAEQAFA